MTKSSYLLRAWRDGETGLAGHAAVGDLLGDGGGAAHVLVGGVGAGANQTVLDLSGPVVLGGGLADLGGEMVEIGGEGAVDTGLELVQVDVNVLIVLGAGVRGQDRHVLIGQVANGGAASRVEVLLHAVVVGEDGGGGTNLSTHVANSSHTSARH